MCQDNCNIKKRKWEQLTWENRILIEHLYNIQKKNFTEIANELGKHRTTISREIRLGLVELENTKTKTNWKYCSEVAQKKNELNETAKGPILKIGNDYELANFIEKQIKKEKYSPEAVIEIIKTKEYNFKTEICWKTIYNYIDKKVLNINNKDLPYRKDEKVVKIKHSKIRKRGKGKSIDERPEEVKTRETIGHWEMDCVASKKGKLEALLVLSERTSRKELIFKIKDKTTSEVVKIIDMLEEKHGNKFKEIFKTITVDNGSEFMDYKGIEQSKINRKDTRVSVYFAHPYSSWERGTNENINRMIRRFIPKGTDIGNITNKEIKRIENWINNYPRKMFNFKTANEIYKEKLVA